VNSIGIIYCNGKKKKKDIIIMTTTKSLVNNIFRIDIYWTRTS